MEIIEFFCTDHKEYWLSKIKESDWGAGQFLYELLKNQCHLDKVFYDENSISYAVMH